MTVSRRQRDEPNVEHLPRAVVEWRHFVSTWCGCNTTGLDALPGAHV